MPFTRIRSSFSRHRNFLESLLAVLLISCAALSIETDTITRSLEFKDPDAIVSSGQVYKLGFFSPKNSTNRYVGIWNCVSETSIVWVANRNKPLTAGSSGTITISEDGNLVLQSPEKDIIWSSVATNSSSNSSAQLLDSGNLVLWDHSSGKIVWQSFRHPTDAFLPTFKLKDNVNTGERVVLTSWKTPGNPDFGNFTAGLKALDAPQIFIWNGKQPHWRSGPWNGLILTGVTNMYSVYLDGYSVTKSDDGTVSFTRNFYGNLSMKIILKPNGSFVQTIWDEGKRDWNVSWVAPTDACDVYSACGRFGNCNMRNSPICRCLKGYEPVNKREWGRGNWSSGCKREIILQCDNIKGDRFSRLLNVKVPDFMEVTTGLTKEECLDICWKKCSCIAYSHDPGIGCMFWKDNLTDVRQFPSGGLDLYVRVPHSILDDQRRQHIIIIVAVVTGFVAVLLSLVAFFLFRNQKIAERKVNSSASVRSAQVYPSDAIQIVLRDNFDEVTPDALPFYNFETVAKATDQFTDDNLLFKAGFGAMYKGKLPTGRGIAVKWLSRASGQVLQEFRNEVVISKLQHRNVISLIGCCVEKQEIMLIYDLMVNRTVHYALFEQSQDIIDWKKRFNIIDGIGRGLLYLHRDSRLTVIHRDLNLSSVLLDENWEPKITHFGMAIISERSKDHGSIGGMCGTRYTAPECARGMFSEKSDVFNFGVMVLEIISGRRSMSFDDYSMPLNLLEHAWISWNEESLEDIIDQRISNPRFRVEIVRCIQIGLLCIQKLATTRPTIAKVLSLLNNEVVDLPVPKQPSFTQLKPGLISSASQSQTITISLNDDCTMTYPDGRRMWVLHNT